VSGSGDKTVRLWDIVTGAALQKFKDHLELITLVAFSLDGKLVMSTLDNRTIRLWDAVIGAAQQTLEGYSKWVNPMAFSPDGKVVHTLSVSNNWVVERGSNILWLSPNYRATCIAI